MNCRAQHSQPSPRSRSGLHYVFLAVCVCAAPNAASAQPKAGSSQFFLGADITALDAPGRGGRAPLAYQDDGKPGDELSILMLDRVPRTRISVARTKRS